MLVSIFGKLTYGDYASVEAWAKAHEIAHRSIGEQAMKNGINLPSPVLMGLEIDDHYLGRHGLVHLALQRLYKPDSSTSASLMMSSLSDWLTESKFYAWHQMHDAIHTRLNAALGVH